MIQPTITCTSCWMTSYNPHDIEHGYCGNCHQFFVGGIISDASPNNEQIRRVYRYGAPSISVFIDDRARRLILTAGVIPADHVDDWINVLKVAQVITSRTPVPQ